MSIPLHSKFCDPASDVTIEVELQEPPHYKVILHNDDYTTMDFVVEILCTVFHRSQGDAIRIMLAVHETGWAECGVYPAEVAETKVAIVHGRARAAGFPLRCSLETV